MYLINPFCCCCLCANITVCIFAGVEGFQTLLELGEGVEGFCKRGFCSGICRRELLDASQRSCIISTSTSSPHVEYDNFQSGDSIILN